MLATEERKHISLSGNELDTDLINVTQAAKDNGFDYNYL